MRSLVIFGPQPYQFIIASLASKSHRSPIETKAAPPDFGWGCLKTATRRAWFLASGLAAAICQHSRDDRAYTDQCKRARLWHDGKRECGTRDGIIVEVRIAHLRYFRGEGRGGQREHARRSSSIKMERDIRYVIRHARF